MLMTCHSAGLSNVLAVKCPKAMLWTEYHLLSSLLTHTAWSFKTMHVKCEMVFEHGDQV